MRKLILTLCVNIALYVVAMAQTNPVLEQSAKTAIQQRGLDEAAVRARLAQEGIDLDNVSPEQLVNLQPRIESILAEMEAEKKASPPTGTPVEAEVKAAPKPEPNLTNKPNEKMPEPQANPGNEIYGHQLFKAKDLAIYNASNDVRPPDTYILSTGDELTISIFGASQFDSKYIINNEGYISPYQMPKIFLKGLRLGQARALLSSRFSNFYRFAPEQFAVSMTAARAITVNVFGESQNVGSFTLSAVNTAFNALVASGGPTDLGSVRQIKVVRGGQTKMLDLYAFLNNPAIQFDFFLEDNDIIQIPVAQKIVAIEGAIRRPYRYEVLDNENLIKLLEFAGGLQPNAFSEVLQVKRFVNNQQVLIDIPWGELLSKGSDFSLLSGDVVIVKDIPSPIENTAAIVGQINLPGAYSLSENKRISDLVKKGGLRPESRSDVAFLSRKNTNGTFQLIQVNLEQIVANPSSAENLELRPQDTLRVFSKTRFADRYSISVRGAIRDKEMIQAFDPNASITIEKAITLSGGLSADANGRGYIMRTNPNNTKQKSYIAVNVAEAMNNPGSSENQVLLPFDELVILSNLTYTDEAEVSLAGAVRNPGKIKYGATLTLKDVLILGGGIRLEAAKNRIDVYRVSFSENNSTRTLAYQLEIDNQYNITSIKAAGRQEAATDLNSGSFALAPFDEVVVRSIPEFEYQSFVELNGEVIYPGRYALLSDNERLSDIIARAGGLSPEADPHAATLFRESDQKGFVVTDLEKALRFKGSTENHVLKSGDVIDVPKQKDLITIKIANTSAQEMYKAELLRQGQINVALKQGKRAGWYIKSYAGGFDKNANRRKVVVIQPNGDLNRTMNLWFIKIYPKVSKGSVISVPYKAPKEQKEKKDGKGIDWDKTLTKILAVTSVLTSAAVAIAAFK